MLRLSLGRTIAMKIGTAIFSLTFCASTLLAQSTPPSAPVPAARNAASPLMMQDIIGMPGMEVTMNTVEYAPGASSRPHRHNAQVFVYVLEGRVTMQVKGGPKLTLGPGQTFYENPNDVHTVSANASATEPAKFLVFMVKDKKAQTNPVTSTGATR